MQNLPLLLLSGMGAPAYFILLVILSLGAALVLFGILRSGASLSGSQFGNKVELGGAAALFIIVLLYGLAQFPAAESEFALTFRFRPPDHGSIAAAFGEENVKKAKVTLFLPTWTMAEGLKSDGYAKIEHIPSRYRINPIEFNLESETFLVKDKQETYKMPTGAEPVLMLDVIAINTGKTKPEQETVTPKFLRAATISSQVAKVFSGGTSDGHSPFCNDGQCSSASHLNVAVIL
jgi:hypothetical protein